MRTDAPAVLHIWQLCPQALCFLQLQNLPNISESCCDFFHRKKLQWLKIISIIICCSEENGSVFQVASRSSSNSRESVCLCQIIR